MEDRLVGLELGDFRLEALIGRGSVGKVYRATQISLNRPVAIKLLEEGLFTLAELRERFLREAQFLARLEHPNIVPVFSAGQQDNLYYYAMRLVDGVNLEVQLADGLELVTGLGYLGYVASALEYAHERGLIHRDIKPANILISHGTVVLTDFGLARLLEESTITGSGRFLGTPLYFSPEQARLERATHQSDLFALGIILYELATGQHPFLPGSREEIILKVRDGNFPSPREVNSELPSNVEEIILRAMALDPAERYANAREMRKAMQSVARVTLSAKRTPSPDYS